MNIKIYNNNINYVKKNYQILKLKIRNYEYKIYK